MSEQAPKKGFKKYIIAFWLIFILALATPSLLFYLIANYEIFGKLPTFEELENPKSKLATQILSSDEKLLGTIFSENRSIAQFDELSPYLIKGLISTEDERFNDHTGIDAKSLARAILKLGKAGGGSTITQQLAKMLFTEEVEKNKIQRAFQKLNEWVIAVKLEKQYTKDEIITMYYNKLDFVNNAAGIKSASKVYFNSTPIDLKVEQAAMLVGMAKNPALFNPLRRPDTTRFRRNVVLGQMVRNGVLTDAEFDSLSVLDLNLDINRASHKEGIATYFREQVRGQLRGILKDIKKPDGSKYNIYRDGLKIITTLDYNMQVYAENAMIQHLGGELQPDFFTHWKKKIPGLKKYAPFYFEDMTSKQKDELKENLILRGIRNSGRYQSKLRSSGELWERTKEYRKINGKYLSVEAKMKDAENERYALQLELNRLKRDTLNQDDPVIMNAKKEVREKLDKIEDLKDELNDDLKDIEPDLKEAEKEYLELWQPFDDSMQVVFNQPIDMTIFKWKRKKNPKGSKLPYKVEPSSVDTIMTPRDSVIYHKWFLRSGLMSIDPHTGFIKAWVGGYDYKHFQYDHVKGTRQVGSTFKPFVYAAAIENGYHPCMKILNAPVTIPAGMYGLEQDWTPKNAAASRLDDEQLTLKMALANSINSVTAHIMKKFGPDAAIKVARRCGITTPIDPVPSICLGTPDVSLYEMVSAYAVFANKGIWIQPSFIMRIEDKNGNIIWRAQPKTKEAMTEENAYKMLQLLGGVASYGPKIKGKSTYGTGVRLRNGNKPYGGIPYNIKIAGKTGTTQMQSDGWFMGITPDLVTGVWTGCEDRAAHFLSLNLGMGTNMALPIWGYYMNSIYKDKEINISTGDFEAPKGMDPNDFDCVKISKEKEQNNTDFDDFDNF